MPAVPELAEFGYFHTERQAERTGREDGQRGQRGGAERTGVYTDKGSRTPDVEAHNEEDIRERITRRQKEWRLRTGRKTHKREQVGVTKAAQEYAYI